VGVADGGGGSRIVEVDDLLLDARRLALFTPHRTVHMPAAGERFAGSIKHVMGGIVYVLCSAADTVKTPEK
jgi:hypothetical protein